MTAIARLILIAIVPLACWAQRSFTIMEWNVENLFHPSDDPLTADEEFTPDGRYHWTYARFHHKLNTIAQTIAAADTAPADTLMPLPDLVALAEVEDDSTLVALTRRSVMRPADYSYLRTHGCDRRGINVALLYQTYKFRPVAVREVVVGEEQPATRNLLYAALETTAGDTLHVIVCHLPSQARGTRQADRHRQLAARTLRQLTDSILQSEPAARLIVTGDFNADQRSTIIRTQINPLRHIAPDNTGTYRYRGDWSHLDHVLCSPTVLADTAHVVRLPWLLEPNKTVGGDQPCRTFRGTVYHRGVSDHLPLIMRFQLAR